MQGRGRSKESIQYEKKTRQTGGRSECNIYLDMITLATTHKNFSVPLGSFRLIMSD